MPELPEVETTLRGIKPHIIKQQIVRVIIRHPRLRWPIPHQIKTQLPGQYVRNIKRRGKYLLLILDNGTCLLHLGMSGRLAILDDNLPAQKHDHVDFYFSNHKCLRFTDPRRFGAVLFTEEAVNQHPLLVQMGPEPLSKAFTGDYLWRRSRGKKVAIKTFLMDSKIVAGIGNIYATEALFAARILPQTSVDDISKTRFEKLAAAIKNILQHAIAKGGTTLKDFLKSDGSPGYFSIALQAYGHAGEACPRCRATLQLTRIGQRSTVFCAQCQS